MVSMRLLKDVLSFFCVLLISNVALCSLFLYCNALSIWLIFAVHYFSEAACNVGQMRKQNKKIESKRNGTFVSKIFKRP